MKIEKKQNYYTIAVYAIVSVILIALAIVCMVKFNVIWGGIVSIISTIFNIFKPLFIGVIIGFLIDPVVDLYDNKLSINYKNDKKRIIATTLAIFTIISILGLFILMIVVNMQDVISETNINGLTSTINAYLEYFQTMVATMTSRIETGVLSNITTQILTNVYNNIDLFIAKISTGFINSLTTIGENLIDIIFGIILALYLVKDKPKLLKIWNNILKIITNDKVYKELTTIGRDINSVFTGYIRGQILDTVIMAVITSIGLTIIGLDFAVIIGVLTGIFNLIPYFGPVVGILLAGIIGAIGDVPAKGLYAMLMVLFLQQIDTWIIIPRILGNNVKLHPIAVLLAILIGGELFGLIGMLAGVPIMALLRVIIIRYVGNIFSEEYSVE